MCLLVDDGCWLTAAAAQLCGVPDWKAGQPDDLRQLGFLPFPVDDVMCPGETKALHLYEVCREEAHGVEHSIVIRFV